MKNIKILLLFVFILFFGYKNNAQSTEIGLGLGFTTYWGDLNSPGVTSNLSNNSGLAIQLSARKMLNNIFGVKGAFTYGSMKGDDANSNVDWQRLRNLSFKSTISELSLMGEFHPFNLISGKINTLSPYMTAGVSGLRFNPKTIYNGNYVSLQPLGTEGQGIVGMPDKYSLYAFSVAIGGGMKLIINDKMSINGDIIMRSSNTDYLDDVSTNYVNYDDLSASNGSISAILANRMHEFLGQSEPVQLPTGTNRGGARYKDYYFVSMLTVNITLESNGGRFGRGSRVICPKF